MARIKVPQSDGNIQVFDGAAFALYKVKDGTITVPDEHVASVLVSVPGSTLVQPPEAPATIAKPGVPAKEH